MINVIFCSLDGVPVRCFLGEKGEGYEPEDNGGDFEAEVRPVEIEFGEPEGGDEYLAGFC